MVNTHFDLASSLFWAPMGPKRARFGPKCPFLPVFDRFLELGGSIWAITVLGEQGIPLRCSGHPTSLYFERKMSHSKWGHENLGSGPKSPFWALSTVLGAQYDQVGAFDIPISKMLVTEGYLVFRDPIWVIWDP